MKRTGSFRKSGGNPRKSNNRQGNPSGRNQNQNQNQNSRTRKGGIHPWVSSNAATSQALTSHLTTTANKNRSGGTNNQNSQNSKNPYRQKRNMAVMRMVRVGENFLIGKDRVGRMEELRLRGNLLMLRLRIRLYRKNL